MADSNVITRSNYFHVTNEEEFRKIIAEANKETVGGVDVHIHCEDKTKPCPRYMIGSFSSIEYPVVDKETNKVDYSLYEFVRRIAALLPDEEAFILVITGNEKLNYVDADAYVATNKSYAHIDLWDKAVKEASHQLGRVFSTDYTY